MVCDVAATNMLTDSLYCRCKGNMTKTLKMKHCPSTGHRHPSHYGIQVYRSLNISRRQEDSKPCNEKTSLGESKHLDLLNVKDGAMPTLIHLLHDCSRPTGRMASALLITTQTILVHLHELHESTFHWREIVFSKIVSITEDSSVLTFGTTTTPKNAFF